MTTPDPKHVRVWALARLPREQRKQHQKLTEKVALGAHIGLNLLGFHERRELAALEKQIVKIEVEILAHWKQGERERAARLTFAAAGEFEARA